MKEVHMTHLKSLRASAFALAMVVGTANAGFAQTSSGSMGMGGQTTQTGMMGHNDQNGVSGSSSHSDINGPQRGMMSRDTSQLMSMMRDMMDMMSANTGMMSSDVAGRIAALKVDLMITDTQAPLWNRFAEALRNNATSVNGLYQQMMQPDFSSALPARLAQQETQLSTHLAAVKSLEAALQPLYASFTAEQRKRADELLIGPMGMM